MILRAWSDGRFELGEAVVRCALGRAGVAPAEAKHEGDGATPLGAWPLRRALYRPDRLAPPRTALPVSAIGPDDGWCDDPGHPDYNRPVRLPHSASCERLWQEDHLYDLLVVLGHNDDPPRPGLGSCIFLHLAREGFPPTEGCVALAGEDLKRLVAAARPGDRLEIRRAE